MENQISGSTGVSSTESAEVVSGIRLSITSKAIATRSKTEGLVGFSVNGVLPNVLGTLKCGSGTITILGRDSSSSEISRGEDSMWPSSRSFGGDWLTVAW